MSAALAVIGQLTNKAFRQATPGTFSFTPTISGWYWITTMGGGRAGGAVTFSAAGHGGMYVRMRHFLTAGTAYSYTVGSGGVFGGTVNGGNTSFTGPVFTQTSLGAIAGTGARTDGVTTDNANATLSGDTVWQGALTSAAVGTRAGGCGCFVGGTHASSYAGGAASMYANGGNANGAGAGGNGALGSGGGSGSTAGGNGGHGFLEIESMGTA